MQLKLSICITWGFQGSTSSKEPACQCRHQKRCGFHPQVRMISWRKRLTCSSTLAWRILWTEKPSGLQSIRLQRVGHNWSDLAHVLYSILLLFVHLIWSKSSILLHGHQSLHFNNCMITHAMYIPSSISSSTFGDLGWRSYFAKFQCKIFSGQA